MIQISSVPINFSSATAVPMGSKILGLKGSGNTASIWISFPADAPTYLTPEARPTLETSSRYTNWSFVKYQNGAVYNPEGFHYVGTLDPHQERSQHVFVAGYTP